MKQTLVYPYYGYKTVCNEQPIAFPPQHQDRQPGLESLMIPRPISENTALQGSGKLKGKVALITGGDSGIGKAAAIAFAKEGADVAIAYLDEASDAEVTRQRIEQLGQRCLRIQGDLRYKQNCFAAVGHTIATFGKLDILVNNHAMQQTHNSILDISEEELYRIFQTNILSYFFLTQAALPHMSSGASIINTASITAYQGHVELIDYSATKGAVISFTRALALSLVDTGIRVNSVSPGPVWTPLIPSSYTAEKVSVFGTYTPMKRAAQPYELAGAYLYLAGPESTYVTGASIHVNGGYLVTN
jgi:NAD(P)-dependent dehydrogenase (short-subunit alcohol dehydrogenase family)